MAPSTHPVFAGLEQDAEASVAEAFARIAVDYFARQYEDNNIFKVFSDGGYRTMAFTHNDLSAVLLYQFREHLDSVTFAEQFFSNTNFEEDHTAAFLSERVIEQGHRGVGWQLPSSLFLSLFYRLWRTRWKTDMQRQNRQDFPRGLPAPSPAPSFYRLEDEIDRVLEQVAASSEPYLGYFHFLPPHEPYNPRREFIGIFDDDGYVPIPNEYTFAPSLGALTLAWTRNCRNQVYRLGERAWGQQFHLVADAALIERWVGSPGGRSEIERHWDARRIARIRAATRQHLAAATVLSDRVFGEFVRLFSGRRYATLPSR